MTPFLAETAPVTHPTITICDDAHGLIHYCTFNWDSLISSAVAILITVVIVVAAARSARAGVPGKLQMVFELLIDYVKNLTGETVTPAAAPLVVPIAMTVAIFILIANWLDVFPLGGPLHPANSDFNQTLAMAVVVWVIVQAYSIRELGLAGSLRRFTKPFEMHWVIRVLFVPLNIVEEFVKPVTLSLRLFGNIFAGVLMVYLLGLVYSAGMSAGGLGVAGGVAGIVGLIGWKAFDVFLIGSLQAFIFMLLTVIYFGHAREGLEEHGHGGHATGHGTTASAH